MLDVLLLGFVAVASSERPVPNLYYFIYTFKKD